jgi:hypothetical protein
LPQLVVDGFTHIVHYCFFNAAHVIQSVIQFVIQKIVSPLPATQTSLVVLKKPHRFLKPEWRMCLM